MIVYGQHTEKGLRHENQDAVTFFSGEKISFFAVADGAGGLSSGRQASQMVIKAVLKEFSSLEDMSPERLMNRISEKYRQMNDYLMNYQSENGLQMATTLTMLHLLGTNYIISNVGDTQAILLKKGRFQIISQVHNLAWVNYLNGEISFEEIRTNEGSHILTRALGGSDTIKPYIASGVYEPGDIFLICTDGFYNHVDNAEIADLFDRFDPKTNERMDSYCRGLVNRALRNGSSDNCTVVVVRIINT